MVISSFSVNRSKGMDLKLGELADKHKLVTAVRGRGLLIGVELAPELAPATVVKSLMEKGFLTGTAGDRVLRFAPPLVVEPTEIDALLVALDEILEY